ncbi:MAG: hypothetical protein H0W72_01565 [Planctomycetes bacterium]|nr:hypothetical protein [Planctomycetota bacterium]
MSHASAPRTGFTLLELLVVMLVIIALAGLGLATYTAVQTKAKIDASRMAVMAVSSSLARQLKSVVVCGSIANPTMRQYWDWNGDTLVDGAPDLDPAFDVAARADATANNYLGTLASARIAIPRGQVDAFQRPLDAWKRPLRIAIASNIYGASPYGIWSTGKDGIDGTADDLTSW